MFSDSLLRVDYARFFELHWPSSGLTARTNFMGGLSEVRNELGKSFPSFEVLDCIT